MRGWLNLALLGGIGLMSLGGYLVLRAGQSAGREPEAVMDYIVIFGLLFMLYLLACYLVLRAGRDLPLLPTLSLIAAVAALARFILVPAAPTLSDDVYRYVWDGRVQAAGVSPYAYAPGAPELEPLHTPGEPIWPNINRKNAITIYPPLAEVFFAVVYRLRPESITATKAAIVAADLLSCLALGLLLTRLGLPATRALIYAWAPLPVVEFGGSGHVESLEILLTLLALLGGVEVVRRSGSDATIGVRAMSLLASTCLSMAGLVKLIPLLLLAGWRRVLGWKLIAWCIGSFAAAYALFVWATGGHVSPFLLTYLGREVSNAPLYYFLTKLIGLPFGVSDELIRLALGLALGMVAMLLTLKRERGPYDFIGKSFLLVGCYLLLATNAHQWYATWLLLFVPLFLPPHGLPIFGGSEMTERARWLRGDYGPALAALAYTGLTFGGYTVFALKVPSPPTPVAAVQLGAVVALGLLWPLLGYLRNRVHARRAIVTVTSTIHEST